MQEPHADDVFATATWNADEAYYRQLFDDWLHHVSQRRYVLPAAAAFVVLGVVLLALGERFRNAGLVAAIGGVLGATWHMWDRRRWLRRVSDGGGEGPVTMQFTADTVYTRGPDSQGECGWRAFQKARLAERGLFLWLSRGMHVYVPYDGLAPPEAAATIAERVNAAPPS